MRRLAAAAALLLAACGGPSPPPEPVRLDLFACVHAPTCFAALDAALAEARKPGIELVIRPVPQDAAEHALAVRLAQLRALAPEAARAVWERLLTRWRDDSALGVGPALRWASPAETGVPLAGPPPVDTFEAVVAADRRAFAALGGMDGPLLLRDGVPVAPGRFGP